MKKAARIRVLVVDDHSSVRKGIAALIQCEPDMEVVADTGDGLEAVNLYRRVKPDVVLMDLRLPGMGGVEATMAIRKEFPVARIIILTTFDTDEDIYRAIQSGAKSYLLKDAPDDELPAMIRAVFKGEEKLPSRVAELLAKRRERADLTPREIDVLNLLVKGRSNKEISSALTVSEDTVKAHLKGLFSKLEVRDRTEAVISAIQHGIVHLN
jgi:two-component system NarL family response regulator